MSHCFTTHRPTMVKRVGKSRDVQPKGVENNLLSRNSGFRVKPVATTRKPTAAVQLRRDHHPPRRRRAWAKQIFKNADCDEAVSCRRIRNAPLHVGQFFKPGDYIVILRGIIHHFAFEVRTTGSSPNRPIPCTRRSGTATTLGSTSNTAPLRTDAPAGRVKPSTPSVNLPSTSKAGRDSRIHLRIASV